MNSRKRYIFLIDVAKININPESVTMANGYPALFYCGASGYENKYKWEEKAPGGTWSESFQSGSKSPLLKVIANESLNGYQFRCKVTNGGAVYYSSPATLIVEVATSGTSSEL